MNNCKHNKERYKENQIIKTPYGEYEYNWCYDCDSFLAKPKGSRNWRIVHKWKFSSD